MEYKEAKWLTALFNHNAENCRVNKITISTESAAGNPWQVEVRTPYEVAEHLRFFRDTELPLLKRGTFELTNNDHFPNPITLEAQGRFKDPSTKLIWGEEQFARFRFMQNDQPSEMCLHGDFNREDRILPLNRRRGPSLNQVISLMYAADQNWSKVNFIMPHIKPLKLVK